TCVDQPAHVGLRMNSVTGKRFRLVVNGIAEGDAFPHVPVGAMRNFRTKAADFFINRAMYDQSRGNKSLFDEQFGKKFVAQERGGSGLRLRDREPVAALIHMYGSASAGFCFWMRCQAISKPLIEPCTNCIVGVEHMHPFARGVADAIVEISDYPNISLLAVKLYPAAADFRDDGFRIIRVRAIIDDRDLHFPR